MYQTFRQETSVVGDNFRKLISHGQILKECERLFSKVSSVTRCLKFDERRKPSEVKK